MDPVKCKLPPEVLTLVSSIADESLFHKCCDVHELWNGCPYVTDLRNYGVVDYWATPMQLSENGGDCEDYAIAKYYTLAAAGVPVEQMYIVAVRRENESHMVLAVVDSGSTTILDNLRSDPVDVEFCGELSPVYAINHTGLFSVDGEWNFALLRADTSNVSLWQDLLKRIEEEQH